MIYRSFHPIVASQKHLSVFMRWRDSALTILLWLIYLAAMKDFVFFLGDAVLWAVHGFKNTAQYKSFEVIPTFLSYIAVTALFLILYIGWARYNLFRFRGKSRRRAAEPVQPEDLARFYEIDKRQVEKWQQAKTLTFHHDAKGRITGVELGSRYQRE